MLEQVAKVLMIIIDWPWEIIGSVVVVLAGAMWSVGKFIGERREDRKWKQVQFLLEINQKFFDNHEIRECIQKLDDTRCHQDLEHTFKTDRSMLKSEEVQTLEKFRVLFQFFDNLSHCRRMDALTLHQICLFGWYLQRIRRIPFLHQYCQENGFENVVELTDAVERYDYSRR
jgi:hypothetical protein